jgi:hypothetical protein
MPSYDYYCEANERVLEVRHAMSEQLQTWGELCRQLSIPLDGTPAETPVRRLANGGQVVRSGTLGSGTAPPCETGGPCCGGGACSAY